MNDLVKAVGFLTKTIEKLESDIDECVHRPNIQLTGMHITHSHNCLNCEACELLNTNSN